MRRSFSLVVPAMLVCIAGPSLAQSEIEVTGVSSLANQPQLIGPVLARSADGLRLRFEAGFANPCLAAQGVAARHVDLGHAHLMVVDPAGGQACPDIWRPARSCFEVELPAHAGAIALLEAGPQRDHTLVLEAERAASLPPEPACRQLPASPLLEGAALPVVLGAEVVQRPAAAAQAYILELELLLADDCAARSPRAQILEGTGQAPMIDWLLIHIDPCPAGAPVVRRATLRHGVGLPVPREVAILNPVEATPRLFPRIEVAP
jgi:hypothetical protein